MCDVSSRANSDKAAESMVENAQFSGELGRVWESYQAVRALAIQLCSNNYIREEDIFGAIYERIGQLGIKCSNVCVFLAEVEMDQFRQCDRQRTGVIDYSSLRVKFAVEDNKQVDLRRSKCFCQPKVGSSAISVKNQGRASTNRSFAMSR